MSMVFLTTAAWAVPQVGVSGGLRYQERTWLHQHGVSAAVEVQPFSLLSVRAGLDWYAHLGQGDWKRLTKAVTIENQVTISEGLRRIGAHPHMQVLITPVRGFWGPFDVEAGVGAGIGTARVEPEGCAVGCMPPFEQPRWVLTPSWIARAGLRKGKVQSTLHLSHTSYRDVDPIRAWVLGADLQYWFTRR